MKIVVLGGTGLIGSKTVAILRRAVGRGASAAFVSTNGSAACRRSLILHPPN